MGPLGLVLFLLLLFGLALWVHRRHGRKARAGVWLTAFAGGFLFFSFPYAAAILELPLVYWSSRLAAAHPVPPDGVDAVLIAGGGVIAPDMINSSSLRRIEYGLGVWRETPEALLVFSEGGLTAVAGAAWLRDYLVFRGVPPDRILLETQAATTRQNMTFTREPLRQRGVKSMVVVTTARHMPRVYFAARKQGWQPAVSSMPEVRKLDFYPNWESFQYLSGVLNEYAGLIGYRLLGWI